ncbi:MAG: hypothetical protein JRG90_15085 [Deltaproteobacteria bacterium]|nr:hypothetical protein [Deltaproteobacteria bacterium]MBW2666482.1 hypothetical protein [Deltaproteobacteria bacterium]
MGNLDKQVFKASRRGALERLEGIMQFVASKMTDEEIAAVSPIVVALPRVSETATSR